MADKEIALLGAGGQAREVREYAGQCGIAIKFWSVSEKYQPSDQNTEFIPLEKLTSNMDIGFVCCVGAPGVKKELVEACTGNNFESIIALNTYLADNFEMGEGVIIAPQVSITDSVSVGSHVLVNTGATISHDSHIGNWSTIGPGVHIGGNVTIGQGTVIGIGATIKHGVTIGDHSYIGAGSVVLEDIGDYATAYGVPAQEHSQREGWICEL